MDSTMKPLLTTDSMPNSPTLSFADDTELDELDGGGSDFSWSSVSPETGIPPAPEGIADVVNQNVSSDDATGGVDALSASVTAQTEENGLTDSSRKHPTYFWECISFMVEGVEFQLPKYRFVEESERFMDLVAPEVNLESDSPIVLDGVSLSDFESFLKAFLPRSSAMYDDKPDLSKDEWISVLKLSTRWFFNDLRKLAISHLSAIKMDGIERICLAKEYRVSHWLQEGYAQIINRLIRSADNDAHPFHRQEVRPLTAEEGTKVGMEVALTLSGLAISLLRTHFPNRQETDFGVNLGIQMKFCAEINAIRTEEQQFLTKKDVQMHRQVEEEELRKLAEQEAKLARELKEREEKREADEREKLEREKNRAAEQEAEEFRKQAEEEGKMERKLRELEQQKEAEEQKKFEREKKRAAEREEEELSKLAEEEAKKRRSLWEQECEAERLKRLDEEDGRLDRERNELERKRGTDKRGAGETPYKLSLSDRLGGAAKKTPRNVTPNPQKASSWGWY